MRRTALALTLLLPLALPSLAAAGPRLAPGPAPGARLDGGALALPFVRNDGQVHRDVAFHTRLRGGALFVTRAGELVYALDGAPGERAATFVERPGARGAIRGERRSATELSFFRGERRHWRSRVPTFEAVSLGEVAPGVALTLEARGGAVEKLFEVAPGADPSRIRVAVKGARGLAAEADGRLAVATAQGTVRFSRPVAYQPGVRGRDEVPVAYRADRGGYGFAVGAYDRSRPLVIDPVLTTFLGGTGAEYGYALAAYQPPSGAHPVLYVAGSTTSFADFPGAAPPGGIGSGGAGGGTDAFVARLDYDLSQATIAVLGGSGEDEAYDLAVHPGTGQVFAVGWTNGGFPMLGSEVGRGAGRDGFVARLDGDLTTLLASRYLGGNDSDAALAIAIEPRSDAVGDLVYVAGWTKSDDLPGTRGAAQPSKAGGRSYTDGFAAVFDPGLTLRRLTYLGGDSVDSARAIAVGTDHRVYVAGGTSYDPAADPVHMLVGCFPWIADQTSFGGQEDAFVVRLAPELLDSETPVARYLGGLRIEFGAALALHPQSGDVYLAGTTTCAVAGNTNDAEFPFPPAPYLPAQGLCVGGQEGFVARLDPATLGLVGATLLGGRSTEQLYAVVAGDSGVHVLGRTQSPDLPALDGAAGPTYGGGWGDAVLAWLSDDLTTLHRVSYLGGSGQDESLGRGLAVVHDPHDGSLQLFAAAHAASDDLLGVPDVDGVVAQRLRGGSLDAFVARLPASLLAPPSQPDVDVAAAVLDFGNVAVGVTQRLPLEIRNLGGAPLHLTADASVTAGGPTFAIQATGSCATLAPTVPAAGSCTLHISFAPPARGRYTGTLQLHSDDPDEPVVTLALAGVSEPDVELLPARPGLEPGFTFPDVALGTSFDLAFTIQNVGTAPLSVTRVTHAGVAPTPDLAFSLRFGPFSLCPEPSLASPLVLAPGQSCGVVVKHQPPDHGTDEGVALVFSDDPDEGTAFMHFTGVCVDESLAPDLVGEPSLDFGEVLVGESRTLTTLVSNRGAGAVLQIRGFVLSETSRFTVNAAGGSQPCTGFPRGIPPLATSDVDHSYCTAEVTFAPTVAEAAVREELVIRSNDPTEPEHVVALVARAVAPAPPATGGGGGGGGLCSSGGTGAGLGSLLLLAAALWPRRRRTRSP